MSDAKDKGLDRMQCGFVAYSVVRETKADVKKEVARHGRETESRRIRQLPKMAR